MFYLFAADGVAYSFGVLFEKLIDYFEEGTGATAWIVSILVGITLCSGNLINLTKYPDA